MTIEETNAAARAEGLSYGQYVDRHRDDGEAEAPEKTRICRQCGKAFVLPLHKKAQRYCSADCRQAAEKDREAARRAEETNRRAHKAADKVWPPPDKEAGAPRLWELRFRLDASREKTSVIAQAVRGVLRAVCENEGRMEILEVLNDIE